MLVGHWNGQMLEDYGEEDARFYADGSCEWTHKYSSSYDQVEQVDTYTGWLWSTSGADQLPDFEAPWILQLRAGPMATAPDYGSGPNLSGETARIVGIDSQGFTSYDDIPDEGPTFFEMKRVP